MAQRVYSYKTYANCTGFIIMVFILIDFILNIPVNKLTVMSAHSTKIKMRGSREGGRGSWKIGNLWGSLAILVQIPWNTKSYQASIPYWVIIAPPAFCCWADDGLLLVVFSSSLHSSKKSVSEFSWTSSDKMFGSAHD